ncbi:olfactory receptor 14A16 [Fukomys damarensis]|uniref:Olfactory receptor n=1 Tax=Fukomys damarensis TaxID=885580 RepID=A0A091EJU7_FUKDA|nr:olfactory receptor 14A16 [Fukomys damarensis]KFO35796.1 Olfactory receptor 14A16 [Fukomys damarensis]
MDNSTSRHTFSLTGFSSIRELQILHAVLFLGIYLAALLGNLLIITLTTKDPHLHSPMYFFLKNLSFLDLCLISITVPKSITNSLMSLNLISFLGCVAQVFFFFLLATTEVALLTVMSYDRYVAICHPLRYGSIMSHRACVQMAAYSWVSGGLNAVLHTAATFSVPMCGPLEVHQFFCDVPQLLSLACFCNIWELLVIGLSLLLDLGCFVFMDVSYVHIFSTVLKMPSREGRSKAFSTCLPHLVVVTLFLSSGFFAYLHPLPKSPSSLDLLVSVFYTVVPPTVNPLIYSLRNKDMQKALRRLQQSWCCPAH